MSKRGAIALLVLVACLAASSLLHADSGGPVPVACEDINAWLSSGVPLSLVEFVCTVIDEGHPVNIELVDVSNQEYESTIRQSEVPEDIKQHLLLLLALWSHG